MEPIKVDYYWFEYIAIHPKFTGCLIDQCNNKAWYKNGEKHREDGPAIEYTHGDKSWYLNGKKYSEQEWLIAMRKVKLEKALRIQS